MSADNMICVQKRANGRWWVWMDFASNDDKAPQSGDVSFKTDIEAWAYARGWHREPWAEYGIVQLDPQNQPRDFDPGSVLVKPSDFLINDVDTLRDEIDYIKKTLQDIAKSLREISPYQPWPVVCQPYYGQCNCVRERKRLEDSTPAGWWCPIHGSQWIFPTAEPSG